METRLLALQLFLEALGIDPSKVETLDDRKRLQKGVYLGQALSGLDLSYRFGWYTMGPYSPALARDYYALSEELKAGSESPQGATLREPYKSSLEGLRGLLTPPATWERQASDWLELLASWHFLRMVREFDRDKSRGVFAGQKPHLLPFADIAERALPIESAPAPTANAS